MASPQWKPYHLQSATVQDPAILAYRGPQNVAAQMSNIMATSPPSIPQSKNGFRETGFIEKLLRSYGFIQCYERDARLFFHYSEYAGQVDNMKIGDQVEFQMSFDKKTSRPIAVSVVQCLNNRRVSFTNEIMGEERVSGTIAQETSPKSSGIYNNYLPQSMNDDRVIGKVVVEARSQNNQLSSSPGIQDGLGRVTYEQKGECFFLPFSQDDVEGNSVLKVGDEVSFFISTDKRNGRFRARSLRVLKLVPIPQVDSPPRTSPKNLQRTISLNPNFLQSNLSNKTAEQKQEMFNHHTSLKKQFSCPDNKMDLSLNNLRNRNRTKSDVFEPSSLPNGNVKSTDNDGTKNSNKGSLQGVICSMKESFGFIERGDAVKEIFFHYSEVQGNVNDLLLGDDVEYQIDIRNDKEIAINIKRLPRGTVIFDDVGVDKKRGKVLKTLKTVGRRSSDPLAGKIVYETLDGPIEIAYGDKDQLGDFTLQVGDLVEFHIATDRRDKLQRATNIQFVEDTFKVNGEKREKGIINSLKEGYGFVNCAEKDLRVFFHFSELLDTKACVKMLDEVEFSIIADPVTPSRNIGVRVKILTENNNNNNISSPGDVVQQARMIGTVEKEPYMKNQGKNKESIPGIILYDVNGTKQTILYTITTVQGQHPKYGDKVEFQISESKRDSTKSAVNVKLINRVASSLQQGFIATLKDNFGFIETAEHDKEVFFHFSAFEGDITDLDLGDEVDFTISRKTGKASAENIKKLPKGSVAPETVSSEVLDGIIMRCMRIVDPGQEEYPGIVQEGTEEDSEATSYTYGITSLADKRDFLQKGDLVKFSVATIKATGETRATDIAALRKVIRSRVDSVKGQYGFLLHEVEEDKKLFFHMTEVHDGVELQPGDSVEFVVVQNQRNGKYSAVSLRKVEEQARVPRPERLISVSRLKSVGDESAPRVIAIRQVYGPDGTKGFTSPRKPWKPYEES